MPTLRTWRVCRDRFPLAGPGEELGIIDAPDRATATFRALRRFGARVVVEPVTAAPRTNADNRRPIAETRPSPNPTPCFDELGLEALARWHQHEAARCVTLERRDWHLSQATLLQAAVVAHGAAVDAQQDRVALYRGMVGRLEADIRALRAQLNQAAAMATARETSR